jgi:hypothetical protein
LNEFLEWARKNARTLAVGAAGLLVLSVVVGFLVGRAQRVGRPEERRPAEEQGGDAKRAPRAGEASGAASAAMLPSPIAPDFDEGARSFSFVLDRADAVLKDMKPVPLRISDLLANKAADVQPDVKPFVYDNEELDVLIKANELAEP